MAEPTPSPSPSAVGAAISSARRRAGLAVGELAVKAGMSQPFLSNLEAGRSLPSITTLYRLAAALGVGANDLLPPQPTEITVVRAGEGVSSPVDDTPDAAASRFLLGGRNQLLEVHEFDVLPGQHLGSWFEHDGEDLVVVLHGALAVELGTDRMEQLAAGDVLHYPARLPHRWRVPDSGGARVLLVNVRTSSSAGTAGHPGPSDSS
jgi:transcriptional regulator with XRE-family HTH domain